MAALTALAFDTTHGVKEATLCNHALYRLGGEVMKDSVTDDTKVSRVCRAVYAQTRDELLRNYPFGFAKKITKISWDETYTKPLGEWMYAYKVTDPVVKSVATVSGSASLGSVAAGLTEDLIGRVIYAVGVPDGTRVLAINETAHTITMDRNATASATVNATMRLAPLKIVAIDNDSLFDLVDSGDSQRILCNIMSDSTDGAEKLEISYVEQVIDPSMFDPLFRDALILRIASKVAMQITSTPRLVQQLQEEFAAIMNIAKQTAAQERQSEVPDDTWTSQAKG